MLIAAILLAALTLAGAVWVVTLRNLFRAALSLGLVLLGIAGLFILLEAEFLAFAQILIYVGAVLTLVIFAVMLTAKTQGSAVTPASRQTVPAAAVSAGLFAVLTAATRPITWPETTLEAPVPVAALGQQLVTTLVLPFEVISLLFVVVAVGAIVLASPRADRDGH
jgi:NADH:ubiquinone oxidoreductase subunit 6 (subunit J)